MRKLLGVVAIAATLVFGSGQAICAGYRMWPDVHGKMVRIPIPHSYAQCRTNARNLGYPDNRGHAWCSEHCHGTICPE